MLAPVGTLLEGGNDVGVSSRRSDERMVFNAITDTDGAREKLTGKGTSSFVMSATGSLVFYGTRMQPVLGRSSGESRRTVRLPE